MQNIATKIVFVVLLVGLCVWSVIPPEDKIRLGKDLRGGVSLVYQVQIPEDSGGDRAEIVSQTIAVLKDRINPKGIFDISITPLGLDRIEIVMPLPNERVQELQARFQNNLNDLLRQAQILRPDMLAALDQGVAVSRYCGDNAASLRCADINDLQTFHDAVETAQSAFDQAEADGSDAAAVAAAANAVALAEIDYERQLDKVLRLSLDRGRVIRVLGLSVKPKKELGVDGKPIIENGKEKLGPSPREDALAALRAEFPAATGQIDAVLAAYDTYQDQRTGLDDPEDLKRLLRGAGVLEFYIAVRPGNAQAQGVNVDNLRADLDQLGPTSSGTQAAKWFPLNELKQWYDDDRQLASLEADPQGYFASRGYIVHKYLDEYFMLLFARPTQRLTHQDGDWNITNTYRSVDSMGRPAVAFQLDTSGGTMMARLTGAHVQEPMAIVLDGEVYSAPTLQSQIASSGIITGNFADPEISYLIRVLAAGSLSARLTEQPVAVNVLGPTIGAENLEHGLDAFVIAIIAVAVFMLIYYFFAGLVADLALLINGLLIFGVMAMIDGTFTLPGLAGIVLTMGMAVDANVLIYERIREEIFAGDEDIRGSIRLGYSKALSTIIDANVTNLIVCFVLFYTATAEVKGFALTLTIGICATLFTALFVTRIVYTLYTDVFKAKSLKMLPTVFPAVHRALEPDINWVGMRKIFWVISGIAVVASLAMVSSRGVDMFDTEFRGGVTATMVTRSLDENNDGQPDRDANNVVQREWLTQAHVEETLRAIAEGADPTGASPDKLVEQAVFQEFANVVVLTAGDTRTTADGAVEATSFQVKVANPKGIADEAGITDIVVNAIVGSFADRLDISPPLSFRGVGDANAASYVFPVETEQFGPDIGEPQLTESAPDYLGGIAIVVRDLDPPVTTDEIMRRIEYMRGQPDHRDKVGRRARVVGLSPVDPSDPNGRQESVVVLVADTNVNTLDTRPDAPPWFVNLAQPEWDLVRVALQRRSSLQHVSSYSSAVAETLSANAIVAVVLTLLGILLYIWVRFGSLRYSAAAIVALVHDVCIALGLLALSAVLATSAFGREFLAIEAFRIDLGVVAALLTIIGYSLNDTIVILDRIRENRGKRPLPSAEIVNRSINQTVSRTLLTSVTTLMAVGIMYSQGGSGIRPFTFCLLTGLVVGTYSSVAIAAPIVFERRRSDSSATPTEDSAATESPTPAGVA